MVALGKHGSGAGHLIGGRASLSEVNHETRGTTAHLRHGTVLGTDA